MSLHAEVDKGHVLGLLGSHPSDVGKGGDRGSAGDRRPEAARAQILLVEDDRAIREVLRVILEEEGYAVTIAENGHHALETLRAGAKPDLIILDLRMPVMDGWQFRAAQKSDPTLADIAVLAISADGSAKAAAIDAAAYLRKPLSSDTMLSTISRILVEVERQRLHEEVEAARVGEETGDPLAEVSLNLDLAAHGVRRHLARASGSNEEPTTLSEMLGECRDGLDRLRRVVKDLQWLSRTSRLTRERVAIETLLDESMATARNCVQRPATLRRQYGNTPEVLADRSAIRQVLLTLLLNVVEALPDGGRETDVILLKTYADDKTVVVEIGESFDPFYATRALGEGAGIGLAVACRTVADHGGRIEVDSGVGEGAVVSGGAAAAGTGELT